MGQLTHTTQEVEDQVGGVYAEIYTHEGATPQEIANGAGYTKCTAISSDGVSNGATADGANSKITITKTGVYKMECSLSFTGDTGNVNWFGSIFVDGVEQDKIHFERKIGSGGDYGSTHFNGIVSVSSVPVDVDLRFRHDDTVPDDITVRYANLNVNRVGV